MAQATVYRVQPEGAELHGVCSVASNEESIDGVFVFHYLEALASSVPDWALWPDETVEVATIICDDEDLYDPGDYEGDALFKGRGEIVRRRAYTFRALCDRCERLNRLYALP